MSHIGVCRLTVLAGALAIAHGPAYAQRSEMPSQIAGGASSVAEDQAQSLAEQAKQREDLAEMILGLRESASGRPLDAAFRAALKVELMRLPVARLQSLQSAGGEGDVGDVLTGGAGTNTLGDSGRNLVFTPVTPCRIIDTRLSAGGLLNPGAKQAFRTTGAATDFSSQGGSPAGCGVPSGATAVALNLGATQSAGPGNIRAYPWAPSASAPTASVINYGNLATAGLATVPNGAIVPICDPAAGACSSDFYLEAFVSGTHLVADVSGYFSRTTIGTSGEAEASHTPIPSTVTSPTQFGTFAISVPAPGRLWVSVDVPLWLDNDSTTTSSLGSYVHVGLCTTSASSATCGGSYQERFVYDPDNASDFNAVDSLTLHRVVPVSAAGTVTLFVNGDWIYAGGAASATMRMSGNMHITWMLLP